MSRLKGATVNRKRLNGRAVTLSQPSLGAVIRSFGPSINSKSIERMTARPASRPDAKRRAQRLLLGGGSLGTTLRDARFASAS